VLARERGDRPWERQLSGQGFVPLFMLGRWDEALAVGVALLADKTDLEALTAAAFLVEIACARGDDEMLEPCISIAERRRESSYVDQRVCAALTIARDALERGAAAEALKLVDPSLRELTAGEFREQSYALAIEAAIKLGDETAIQDLVAFVDTLPPARATPLLRAGRARLAAELAHRRGDPDAAGRAEQEAIGLLRSVGARPLLAKALLERAHRGGDAQARAEARAIYQDLGARRWLERIDQVPEVAA
jgi:hypothetical protein